MKKVILTAVGAAGLMTGSALAGNTLYDNGGPNGVNGYSNATVNAFGARRTILDDFILDQDSTIQDFHWSSVWGTPGIPIPQGSGMELSFLSDAGGMPGITLATAVVTGYSEVGTGNIYFSREEAQHWVTIEDLDLAAGQYWFEATVIGPENNFWLTADQQNNECWVNYDDLGGLQSGTQQFGSASDINFRITGVATPAPGALALLGLAGLAGRRRRRA